MTSTFSQSSVGFLANHMARLFEHGLRQQIAKLGIAPAQFMALVELWDTDGQTQAALTARLGVEQATLANTLARMERDGLITREPHPQDGRARLVRLSERVSRLRGPALAAAQDLNMTALDGLSEGEREQFLSLMRRVIANLR